MPPVAVLPLESAVFPDATMAVLPWDLIKLFAFASPASMVFWMAAQIPFGNKSAILKAKHCAARYGPRHSPIARLPVNVGERYKRTEVPWYGLGGHMKGKIAPNPITGNPGSKGPGTPLTLTNPGVKNEKFTGNGIQPFPHPCAFINS